MAAVAGCGVVLAAAVAPPWVLNVMLSSGEPGEPVNDIYHAMEFREPTGGAQAFDFPEMGAWGLVLIISALALALILAFWKPLQHLVRTILNAVRHREEPEPTEITAVGITSDDVASAVSTGVERALGRLDTEHRQASEAVIAAWVALEEATALIGIDRNPADTPHRIRRRRCRPHQCRPRGNPQPPAPVPTRTVLHPYADRHRTHHSPPRPRTTTRHPPHPRGQRMSMPEPPHHGIVAPLVVAALIAGAIASFDGLISAALAGLLVLAIAALIRIAPQGSSDEQPSIRRPQAEGTRSDVDILARSTKNPDNTSSERAVQRVLALARTTLTAHGIDPTDPDHANARTQLLGSATTTLDPALAATTTPRVTYPQLVSWLDVLEKVERTSA